jgi:ribosome biogenesis protein Nip4
VLSKIKIKKKFLEKSKETAAVIPNMKESIVRNIGEKPKESRTFVKGFIAESLSVFLDS